MVIFFNDADNISNQLTILKINVRWNDKIALKKGHFGKLTNGASLPIYMWKEKKEKKKGKRETGTDEKKTGKQRKKERGRGEEGKEGRPMEKEKKRIFNFIFQF